MFLILKTLSYHLTCVQGQYEPGIWDDFSIFTDIPLFFRYFGILVSSVLSNIILCFLHCFKPLQISPLH